MTPRRCAQLMSVVIGSAVLVFGAARGVTLTRSLLSPPARAVADAQQAAFRCVQRDVIRAIPPHATVYVAPGTQYWDQRVIELTYPRFRFTAHRADAAYVVRVATSGSPCADRAVQVGRQR